MKQLSGFDYSNLTLQFWHTKHAQNIKAKSTFSRPQPMHMLFFCCFKTYLRVGIHHSEVCYDELVNSLSSVEPDLVISIISIIKISLARYYNKLIFNYNKHSNNFHQTY